ncbi:MAG: putative protein kinase [Streblomastix strix]|uniref:non-specific serine/threonine protein kinase n=1 Tax=Streblomastix strix TaxID=222440 RepID=A0A5J4VFQ1_9EUKA|nr:MAG: putative protein kinase [Streblomastix strix]
MSHETTVPNSKMSKKYKVASYINHGAYADIYRASRISDGKQICFKKLSEEQITDWMIQVLLALQYIHSRNIVHRDVKPKNIFLTKDGQAKLGDFGISIKLTDSNMKKLEQLGTTIYYSPEMCNFDRNKGCEYDFKTDIWSLGITIYELCCHCRPFNSDSKKELFKQIIHNDIGDKPKEISDDLWEVLKKMLTKGYFELDVR